MAIKELFTISVSYKKGLEPVHPDDENQKCSSQLFSEYIGADGIFEYANPYWKYGKVIETTIWDLLEDETIDYVIIEKA